MNSFMKKVLITEIIIMIILLLFSLFYDISSVYIFKIRLVKVLAIILFAINLSFSTVCLQVISNNYIVTPAILGMNSIYLTIHTAIVFFFGIFSVLNTSSIYSYIIDIFIMGVFSTALYSFLFKITKYNLLYILLIGIIVTGLFSSIQETLVRLIDPNDYQNLLSSITPSVSNISYELLIISYFLSILVLLFYIKEIKKLDVIQLSKDVSINLGIDYTKTINKLLFFSCILNAISTSLVGNLIFLGLIITNISRYLFDFRNKNIIISSIFIGIIILLLSDIVSNRIFLNNVPINIFIDFFGGIYFLFLFLKSNKLKKGLLKK